VTGRSKIGHQNRLGRSRSPSALSGVRPCGANHERRRRKRELWRHRHKKGELKLSQAGHEKALRRVPWGEGPTAIRNIRTGRFRGLPAVAVVGALLLLRSLSFLELKPARRRPIDLDRAAPDLHGSLTRGAFQSHEVYSRHRKPTCEFLPEFSCDCDELSGAT
jgi:hypothetical protein